MFPELEKNHQLFSLRRGAKNASPVHKISALSKLAAPKSKKML
jgi:hypothetical protein